MNFLVIAPDSRSVELDIPTGENKQSEISVDELLNFFDSIVSFCDGTTRVLSIKYCPVFSMVTIKLSNKEEK